MNTGAIENPVASLTLGHRGRTDMSVNFGYYNPKILLSSATANHVEFCKIVAALAGKTPRLVIDEDHFTALRVYKVILNGF
jgi:hypothetical protein